MSLFGAPQPPPPTSPPSAQVATFTSSPPPRPSSEPTSIERDDAIDDDTSDDYGDDDDEEEGEEGEDLDDERPNKFRGTPAAWKQHAANELDLHHALSQLESNDLSKHLYLAHTLHSRLRGPSSAQIKPYQSKSRWIDAGVQENSWVPPRSWTAWPLEPSEVPRKWERFGEIPDIDPEDEFTYREEGYVKGKPSRDLEEFILSIVLRKAKEQWNGREEERQVEKTQRKSRRKQDGKIKDEDLGSPNSSDAEREKESRRARESTAASSNPGTQETRASAPVLSRPILIADDDAAQRLIQPAISSLIGKLDSVLAALHRSRKNLHDYSDDSINEEIATASDATKRKTTAPKVETGPAASSNAKKRKMSKPDSEAEPAPKRARGRPRKPNKDVSVRKIPARPPPVDAKRSKGRPKSTTLLPGETYYMRKKRLKAEAEAQAKAEAQAEAGAQAEVEAQVEEADVPADEDDGEPSPQAQPPRPRSTSKRSRRSSAASNSSDESGTGVTRPSGAHAYGLRDWSELLSTASLIGAFKPSVIHRAAQRCSNIFNEGMSFHVLEEQHALRAGAGEVVEYHPGFAVPAVGYDESSDDEAVVDASAADENAASGDEADDSRSRRPVWDGVSTNCPHASCHRHLHAFDDVRPLRLHVQMKHGHALRPPPRDKHRQTAAPPTLVGAVHNDGFLQPVAGRRGWRGRDVDERQPGRWDGSRSRTRSRVGRGAGGGDGDAEAGRERKAADAEGVDSPHTSGVDEMDDAEETAVAETQDESESDEEYPGHGDDAVD